MSEARHFSNDREVGAVWMMRNAEFAARFPGVRGRRVDSFSRLVGKVDGELVPVTRVIYFKSSPSLHQCGPKCRSAKGHDCECLCGGKFHGIDH